MSIHLDSPPKNGTCVTIGNFDGVHLGHQALIARACELAREKSLEPVIVTFWPHPRMVLPGSKAHMPLTNRAERLRILRSLGIRHIFELPFDQQFAALSAREFMKRHLLPLNMRQLIVGHDFTLGKNREGNMKLLRIIGQEYNFEVQRIAALRLEREIVSSTLLRQSLLKGDVHQAARLLGRFHTLKGHVSHGFGRGAGLGFPTANLADPDVLVPGNGVYATFAHIGGQILPAVTNIGFNPTFDGRERSIESFLLDTSLDLYGREIRLEFVDGIRSERKFASAGDLSTQIQSDVRQARAILANSPRLPARQTHGQTDPQAADN